jgi:phosphoserine phosphatase
MKQYIVDAFTDKPFSGNPAAVCVMDEWAAKNKIIPHVVRAYSDHWSDAPMMEIADEQVWIDSKTGLRK